MAEDDPVLVDGISAVLRQGGYAVHCVSDGIHARDALLSEDYDLAILDLGLPRMDGLDVLKGLREGRSTMPVLIVSARGEVMDRIAGLRIGADDYLAKPFDLMEFEARVEGLLRRSGAASKERKPPLADAAQSQDPEERPLTPREQSLLDVFSARPGEIVSREEIASLMGIAEESISDNLVQIQLSRLRKKLAGGPLRIRTVRGMGYVLQAARTSESADEY